MKKFFSLVILFIVMVSFAAENGKVVDSGFPAEYNSRAKWVWYPEKFFPDCLRQTRYFRRKITLEKLPVKAIVYSRADDILKIFINGREIPGYYNSVTDDPGNRWRNVAKYDITPGVKTGENVIAAPVRNVVMCA